MQVIKVGKMDARNLNSLQEIRGLIYDESIMIDPVSIERCIKIFIHLLRNGKIWYLLISFKISSSATTSLIFLLNSYRNLNIEMMRKR